MKLNELKPNTKAIIIKIDLPFKSRQRLIAMGVIEGCEIYFERNAPFKDPQEFCIHGNFIALRHSFSEKIMIELKP